MSWSMKRPLTENATNPSSFDPGTIESFSSECQFCHIAKTYSPHDPKCPPSGTSSIDPDATRPNPSTFLVLSTPLLIAFLDVMPLSYGHLLLCPRAHRVKLTDVLKEESQDLGYWLKILSQAVAQATGVYDWNVVQNNGAAAAQVVPHAHFHLIPRPGLKDLGRERFTSTMFGRGKREDLDEEEACVLAERIRIAIADILSIESRAQTKL